MKSVVVVGGGPVGTVLSLLLAQRDISVYLIDAGASFRKVCGEGILPAGWRVLAELGLADSFETLSPIRGLVYRMALPSSALSMSASLSGHAFGMQRAHLLGCLRKKIESHPRVNLLDGCRFRDFQLVGREVEVVYSSSAKAEGTLRASLLVGADGLHSKVRKKAGLQVAGRAHYQRWGARCYFKSKERRDHVEVSLGSGMESYLTPLGDELYGLAFLWSPQQLGRPLPGDGPLYQRLMKQLPDSLRSHLPSPSSEFWAGDTAIGPLQQVVSTPVHGNGRVALVGDAGGYFDALTGEGLCLGFQQAKALADCIERDDVGQYQHRHRAIKRRHNLVVGGLLWLIHQPRLRERVFRALECAPDQFRRVIRFAVEDATWLSLLSPDTVKFLFRLVKP